MDDIIDMCVFMYVFICSYVEVGEACRRGCATRVMLDACAQVVSSPSRKRYQFYIDDVLRTETSSFLGQPWSEGAVSANFTICGVEERVGARLELGDYPLTRCCSRLM